MVVEGTYGQFKGRWQFLLRKSESNHYEVKMATLACMVLHNVCLEQGDTLPAKLQSWPKVGRTTTETCKYVI